MVLNPVISKLAGKLVVLASASPRRLEILSNVGLRFEVVPSWFKETLDKGLFKAPHEYAVETAKQKALEVARRMPVKHLKTPDIVIGADTIVTVDGMILEKPADKADAYRMLSLLSGKEHSVFTGVAIVFCHQKENGEVDYQLVEFYEETKVKFADLSDEMLWEYINSGEPMDKAGGYGIQALGGMLVEYVHGDFLNVVGFPLNRFFKQLDLIYNQSASSPGRGGGAARPSHVGAPASSPLALPPPTHEANGSSKHLEDREGRTGDSEDAALPQMTSRGPSEPEKEDMQRIIDLMDGFKASKALFTASRMRVFDLLQRRPGLEAAQVAREAGAELRGAERLLEACVSLGLLSSSEGRCQRPVFHNTDLSARFLLSDAPRSLLGHIARCDHAAWPLFSQLHAAVRDGAGRRQKALGETAEDALQDTSHNSQEDTLGFMSAMHSVAKATGRAVATAFDLSRFKTACDLGGCTGAMAYEVTRAHPGVSVTVLDLPAVTELSGRFRPLHTDNRVSFVAGDFFQDELPQADLYVVARILHDLPEEKVHILLSRISAACSAGGGLLLSEVFLSADRGGPARGLLQALGQGEGRQRSAEEYALLLESHGFVAARGVHTGDLLDAMLGLKA